ncbi:MAG: TerC family protein [Armatimonadetes bacterium]|nr:TerC family protein [Armatimonadota bacterium]
MHFFDWVSSPQAWVALATLLVLEIVLGIDNIIFISILSGKLPEEQRKNAQQIGLLLALITRVLLLLAIKWIIGATAPVFEIPIAGLAEEARNISWRDIVLGLGGFFLIWKSVKEIHHKLEGEEEGARNVKAASFVGVLIQIMILDIVFSLDSVITAVGMADDIGVMIVAVILAVGFMMLMASKISGFVERHPTIKVLALSFLVLIGVNLVAEAGGQHIEKGYTYVAMAFAVIVEMLNIKVRHKSSS